MVLTLHVGKTGEGPAGLSKARRRSHQSAQKRSLLKRPPEWPKGTPTVLRRGVTLLGIIEVVGGGVVEDFVEIAGGFEAGHREVHH